MSIETLMPPEPTGWVELILGLIVLPYTRWMYVRTEKSQKAINMLEARIGLLESQMGNAIQEFRRDNEARDERHEEYFREIREDNKEIRSDIKQLLQVIPRRKL